MTLSRSDLRHVHLAERQDLIATLRHVGPGAPTLCQGWTATQIASHLVISEMHRGTWWVAGWHLRRLLGPERTMRLRQRGEPTFEAAMRRAERGGWESLLARLAAGPPALFAAPGLTRIRVLEDWVHHEDVRRANGLPPRPPDGPARQAMVEGLRQIADLPEFRRNREAIGVALDGTVLSVGDEVEVTLHGEPGEILLALAGRRHAADVVLTGRAELLDTGALAL